MRETKQMESAGVPATPALLLGDVRLAGPNGTIQVRGNRDVLRIDLPGLRSGRLPASLRRLMKSGMRLLEQEIHVGVRGTLVARLGRGSRPNVWGRLGGWPEAQVHPKAVFRVLLNR